MKYLIGIVIPILFALSCTADKAAIEKTEEAKKTLTLPGNVKVIATLESNPDAGIYWGYRVLEIRPTLEVICYSLIPSQDAWQGRAASISCLNKPLN